MSQVTPPVPVSTLHPPCTKRGVSGAADGRLLSRPTAGTPLQRRNFLCCGSERHYSALCQKKCGWRKCGMVLAAKVTSLIRSHAIPFFVTALPLQWDKKVMYRKPLNYSWSNFCRFWYLGAVIYLLLSILICHLMANGDLNWEGRKIDTLTSFWRCMQDLG